MIVTLKNLRFFAFHGVFPEEKKAGNNYLVDLSVHLPDTDLISDLNDTINYETLYQIVKNEMNKPRDLMDTLAAEIAAVVYHHDNKVKRVEISITKQQPPISGYSGSAGITLIKEF